MTKNVCAVPLTTHRHMYVLWLLFCVCRTYCNSRQQQSAVTFLCTWICDKMPKEFM